MTPRGSRPIAAAVRRHPLEHRADGPPDRARRHGPWRPCPTSNWGFTSGTIRAAGALSNVEATGPSTLSSEMNETSMTARRTGSGRVSGGEPARVRPLERDDPGIRAELFGELTATHVESIDTRRTALQQHVREAAGRSADVEADEPGRVDPERVERGGQLVATPAHVRVRLRDRRASPLHRPGRPASGRAGPRRPPPPGRGRRGAAPGRGVRLGARPRSTSSWSSRTRGERVADGAHPPIVA